MAELNGRPAQPGNVGDTNEPEAIANVFVFHFRVKFPLGPARQGIDDRACSCPDLVLIILN